LINDKGDWIVKPKFNTVSSFDENGIAIVSKSSYGLINRKGQSLSSFRYDKIFPFSKDGLALVKYKERIGYLDMNGKLKIPAKFLNGYDFSEGYAVVQVDSGYGVVNTSGEFTYLNSLVKVFKYDNGVAAVKARKRKSGILDANLNVNLIDSMRIVKNFAYGKAVAKDEHGYYYIDQFGNKLFNKHFEQANDFEKSEAIVMENGHWGIINDKGIFIVSPKYDDIKSYKDDLAAFRNDYFCGVIDQSGKKLLSAEYEFINYCGNNVFRVERNNRVGYISSEGKWIWEPQM
jgi:hypothetical protein